MNAQWNNEQKQWLHIKLGIVSCDWYVNQLESKPMQSENLTQPICPYWLATNYKPSVWAGIYMTQAEILVIQFADDRNAMVLANIASSAAATSPRQSLLK